MDIHGLFAEQHGAKEPQCAIYVQRSCMKHTWTQQAPKPFVLPRIHWGRAFMSRRVCYFLHAIQQESREADLFVRSASLADFAYLSLSLYSLAICVSNLLEVDKAAVTRVTKFLRVASQSCSTKSSRRAPASAPARQAETAELSSSPPSQPFEFEALD